MQRFHVTIRYIVIFEICVRILCLLSDSTISSSGCQRFAHAVIRSRVLSSVKPLRCQAGNVPACLFKHVGAVIVYCRTVMYVGTLHDHSLPKTSTGRRHEEPAWPRVHTALPRRRGFPASGRRRSVAPHRRSDDQSCQAVSRDATGSTIQTIQLRRLASGGPHPRLAIPGTPTRTGFPLSGHGQTQQVVSRLRLEVPGTCHHRS